MFVWDAAHAYPLQRAIRLVCDGERHSRENVG